MYSKSQFYALEVMCHGRAAAARKDMEYWLNEADGWAQLGKGIDKAMTAKRSARSSSERAGTGLLRRHRA